jgi:alpha-mannosidase
LTHLSTVIESSGDRLRRLTQHSIQSQWRAIASTTDQPPDGDGEMALLNDRHHIAWGKGERVLWLLQTITVPESLDGYPLEGLALRFSLRWWAVDAQIFVDGVRVQVGDLYDCATRILLSPSAKPGETFQLALRLLSPGHDDGAFVQSDCLYEQPDGAVNPVPEPGFVADELAVLHHYVQHFAPEQLDAIAQAVQSIPWAVRSQRHKFDRALLQLRQSLQPLSELVKQRTIQILGHAHLDMAWLWPIPETWEMAERTFRSVLDLQRDFPELIFGHSTPALYDWIAQHRPALFQQIDHHIQAGTWEVTAGLWVEPDFNVVHGESIVRQVLYGQRYTQKTFGKTSAIAWLPDSFGFCWQLPQIFRQGGIEYFATLKLDWNDSNRHPYRLFNWRSPDGTEIPAIMLPPIGTGIDPTQMATYAADWEQKTQQSTALWLPGVGDHGGGPTRDMLNLARRWQQSPFFPNLTYGTAESFARSLPADLPTWNDELYLELHRGCYTTHADQKWFNRRGEETLYQAELWSSIATLLTGVDYPAAAIETAWKQVLFNQFHDILPGTCIPEVFTEANENWQAALTTAQTLRDRALHSLAAQIALTPPIENAIPFLVVNSLNWARSHRISMPILPGNWRVMDEAGQPLPTQPCPQSNEIQVAVTVPSIGYRILWCAPADAQTPALPPDGWCLENDHLRVTIDDSTGDIAHLFDKSHQRDVMRGGNQLQAFRDRGQYWDAWNIAPDYADHPLPLTVLQSIEWVEYGPLMQRLRVVRRLGQSDFVQDYVLEARSPILRIETQVDWQEEQVVVKAAFPMAIAADVASYEMPFGTIQRPTHSDDPYQQAKWEVPALRWADLSDEQYGVSILSDLKHGYDSQPSQLRLTLLKAPLWPDPTADRGHHQFTYAIYPHTGSWQTAQTVRRGYELNQPLHVLPLETHESQENKSQETAVLPTIGNFLNLPENLILTALKRAEDDPTRWVLRWYECHGETAIAPDWNAIGQLSNSLDCANVQPVNLLEQPETHRLPKDRPWAIASVIIPVLPHV